MTHTHIHTSFVRPSILWLIEKKEIISCTHRLFILGYFISDHETSSMPILNSSVKLRKWFKWLTMSRERAEHCCIS